MTIKPRTHLILDTVILLLFGVTLVSGRLLWGLYPSGSGQRLGHGRGNSVVTTDHFALLGLDRHTMREIHDWSGMIMATLVLVHLLFHWKWIVCQVRHLRRGSRPTRAPRGACPEP